VTADPPTLPVSLPSPLREEIDHELKFTRTPQMRWKIVEAADLPTREQLGHPQTCYKIVTEQARALAYHLTPLERRSRLELDGKRVDWRLNYIAGRAGALDDRTGNPNKINRPVLKSIYRTLVALPDDWAPWPVTQGTQPGPLPEERSPDQMPEVDA